MSINVCRVEGKHGAFLGSVEWEESSAGSADGEGSEGMKGTVI